MGRQVTSEEHLNLSHLPGEKNAIPYTNSFFSLGISETPPISICTDC